MTAPAKTPGIAADPTVDPLLSTQVGEFIVEERIGAGGMGVVYRASHPLIGKQVAIKVLRSELVSQEQVERLLIEARAVNAIRHPGIIDIFGFGTLPDGRPYIIMELLRGYSLSTLIRQSGRLDAGTTVRILDEMLSALGAAHRAGVVHRDLKPGNVFMAETAEGTHAVKLVDFGIAKLVQSQEGPTTLEGTLLGTPEFMAPEQIRGAPSSPSMDLYAVGVIAFQMLTGERPFKGEPFQVLFAHVEQPPPAPSSRAPNVPPELDTLVLQLLAKDPALRLSSAEAVRQALRRVPGAGLQPRPLTPKHPVPVPVPITAMTEREAQTTQAATLRLAPGQGRKPQWAAGLVVLAGLAGAGSAWLFWPEETAQARTEVAGVTEQPQTGAAPPAEMRSSRTPEDSPKTAPSAAPPKDEVLPSEQKPREEARVPGDAAEASPVAENSVPQGDNGKEGKDTHPTPEEFPAQKQASTLKKGPVKEPAQAPKAALPSPKASPPSLQDQLQKEIQRLEVVRGKHVKLEKLGSSNSEVGMELERLTKLAGSSPKDFNTETLVNLQARLAKVEAELDEKLAALMAASAPSASACPDYKKRRLEMIGQAEEKLRKNPDAAPSDWEELARIRKSAENMQSKGDCQGFANKYKGWENKYLPEEKATANQRSP